MEVLSLIDPQAEVRPDGVQDTQQSASDVTNDEEDWLMATNASDRADRIEQKLDRIATSLNELHREFGAVLARDVQQEKDVDVLRQSMHAGRDGLGKDLDTLEGRVSTLQREYDKATSALQAKVQILMYVASALATAVFGLLVNLAAKYYGG